MKSRPRDIKKKSTLRISATKNKPDVESSRPVFAKSKDEIKIYGVNACRAVWKFRPNDVIKLYLLESRIGQFGDVLKWAAQQRIAYKFVEEEDLDKLTQSEHHEGVCMVVIERRPTPFDELLENLNSETKPRLVLFIDGVENPHNLGALVRTCAHFGIRNIIGETKRLPRMSGASTRVAEGGAENVEFSYVASGSDAIQEIKKIGYTVITTIVTGGDSLYSADVPEKTLLVIGAEAKGVAKPIQSLADQTVSIPGTGSVESLNVATAFGIVAAEYFRRHSA